MHPDPQRAEAAASNPAARTDMEPRRDAHPARQRQAAAAPAAGRSLKIAVVSNWTEIGGGEICLVRVLEGQPTLDPVFHLPEGRFSAWLASLGLPVAVLKHLGRAGHQGKRLWWAGYAFRFLAGNLELLRCVRRERADLILGNGIGGAVYCFLPSLLSRRPFVWIHHNVSESGLERLAARFLAGAARKVIAVSAAAAAPLAPGSGRAVEVVHNGIDLSGFPVLGPASGPVRIALVGRICPDKGQHLLLDAVVRMASAMPDGWRVEFIGPVSPGDRGYEEALRHEVRLTGLEGKVAFPGSFAAPGDIYGRMDIVVSCSQVEEAFPTCVLEAMASGRVVVGFARGGVLEQVKDGETGFLAAPGDPADLARVLEACVRGFGSPAMAAVRSAARAHCEERFDIRRTRERYRREMFASAGRGGEAA